MSDFFDLPPLCPVHSVKPEFRSGECTCAPTPTPRPVAAEQTTPGAGEVGSGE